MVFNATFNSISVISWRSVLLVEETGVPRYIYIYIHVIFILSTNYNLSQVMFVD